MDYNEEDFILNSFDKILNFLSEEHMGFSQQDLKNYKREARKVIKKVREIEEYGDIFS